MDNFSDMKKGKALIRHLILASPIERAKYLIDVIDPYLHRGLNVFDSPEMSRDEAHKITVQRSSELFECTHQEIEKGYSEFRYYLPFGVINKYFFDHQKHGFISSINRALSERSALMLFDEVEKPKIDSRIKEYMELGLPVSEVLSEVKSWYKYWSTIPRPEESSNLFMYYCWRDYIEPYLKQYETAKPIKEKIDSPHFQNYLINIPQGNIKTFAENLRDAFRNEKGLSIRYMLEALIEMEILTIGDRERAALFRSMKGYFDWDIGTKQGIFDETSPSKENIGSARKKIEAILKK